MEILLFGTCRILFDRKREITVGHNKYIHQPAHYSTSPTEVISNLDIITGVKNIDGYQSNLIDKFFYYTLERKLYSGINGIDLAKCVVVVEICSDKYLLVKSINGVDVQNTLEPIIVPYKCDSETISTVECRDNIVEKISEMMKRFNLLKVIWIPPIINSMYVTHNLREIRMDFTKTLEMAFANYDNCVKFDWNALFDDGSFVDKFHFSAEFKQKLLLELDEFICEQFQ